MVCALRSYLDGKVLVLTFQQISNWFYRDGILLLMTFSIWQNLL